MSILTKYQGDSSAAARGITDEYGNGRQVADNYWESAPVLHAMGDPMDRTSTAEEQLAQARDVLGVQVTDEEARGFTDRWNELQAGVSDDADHGTLVVEL